MFIKWWSPSPSLIIRWRGVFLATAIVLVYDLRTILPPFFHQIHKNAVLPIMLWKSQNTPLPNSHLPSNMITFRVLSLAHTSLIKAKHFRCPAWIIVFFIGWFLLVIWTFNENEFDNMFWVPGILLHTALANGLKPHVGVLDWGPGSRMFALEGEKQLPPFFWHEFNLQIINMC